MFLLEKTPVDIKKSLEVNKRDKATPRARIEHYYPLTHRD